VSAADVDTVRRLYAGFNRDGIPAILPFLDGDVEWHEWAPLPGGEVVHGRERLRSYLESLADVFDSLSYETSRFDDREPEVHVATVFHGHARGSGAEVEIPTVHVWTFREGRIVCFQALEA
jgi:ketosteroid isomerase-like protein